MSGQINSWTLLLVASAVFVTGSENQAHAQLFRRLTEATQPEAKNPNAKQDPRAASANANSKTANPKTAQPARTPTAANPPSNSRTNGQQSRSPVNAPQAYRPQPNPQQRAVPNTNQRPQQNAPQARQQQPQAGAYSANPNSRNNASKPQQPYQQQSAPQSVNARKFTGTENAPNTFGQSNISQPRSIRDRESSSERISDENARAPKASGTQPLKFEQPKAIGARELHQLFGMTLAEQDDVLIVKQLQDGGNAAEAGLQPGDSIVSVGGASITNERELGEIASLLSQGDQIEMSINRDGKEDKVFVQFGESDKENVDTNPNATNLELGESNWSSTPASESERLKQLVSQQQQVINELQKRIRELEQNQGSTKF